jgi:hypothetical protein
MAKQSVKNFKKAKMVMLKRKPTTEVRTVFLKR